MQTGTQVTKVELSQAQKERILRGTPGLAALPAAALAALAAAMGGVQLAPLTVMPALELSPGVQGEPTGDSFLAPHTLTVSYRGQLATTQTRPAEQSTWVRMGHVCVAADTLVAWLDDNDPDWRDQPAYARFAKVMPVRTSYQSLDVTDALQLPPGGFEGLFGADAPYSQVLREALLDLWAVEEAAVRLERSLALCSQLVSASPTMRFALLEGARLRMLRPGEVWDGKVEIGGAAVPAMGLLHTGLVDLLPPGAAGDADPLTRLVDVGAWGLNGLLNGEAPEVVRAPRDQGDASLVALPLNRFQVLFRHELQFQRLLVRHGLPEDSPLWAEDRVPGQAVVLLTRPPGVDLPAQEMGATLAETVREQLSDTVLYMRLYWGPPRPGATPPPVEVEQIAIQGETQARQLTDQLDRELRPGGGGAGYDVVIVDALALTQPDGADEDALHQLQLALDQLWAWRGWSRISWIYSDYDDWLGVPFSAAQNPASLLPTRLLGPLSKAPVLPSVWHTAVALVEDWLALQAKLLALLTPNWFGISDFFEDVARTLIEWASAQAEDASVAGEYQPLQAVRLRFDADVPTGATQVTGDGDAAGYSRWARAVTGRRMGLALGGGGALGFAHVAFIRALQGLDPSTGDAQTDGAEVVPIDVITGTSFGAVVGAYFAAAGPASGLDRVVSGWPLAFVSASFAVLTTYGFKLWIDLALGRITLDQFSVTYIPVATAAIAEQAVPITRALVGTGVRASGSFPPFAPTYIDGVRLLDGGIVANVPVYIAMRYGADLVVASNPIPMFDALGSGKAPDIPVIGPALASFSPLGRVKDLLRSYIPLIRDANNAEALAAQVTFSSNVAAAPFAFWQAKSIVQAAATSENLAGAVRAASALWKTRLRGGPSD